MTFEYIDIYHEQLPPGSQVPEESRTRKDRCLCSQQGHPQHRTIYCSSSLSHPPQNRHLLRLCQLRFFPQQVPTYTQSIFPFFSVVNPGLTTETDEMLALRIADELTKVQQDTSEKEELHRFGFLLKGFPFNTTQALLLDRYINGVNLALHVRTANES